MTAVLKKHLLLAACTILNLFCLFTLMRQGRFANTTLAIGSFTLPTSSLQGTLSAFIMMLCILMVFISYNTGCKIAMAIILISMSGGIMQMIRSHMLYPLPGIIFSLIALLSVFIVARFNRRNSQALYTDFITGLENRRKFIAEVADLISSKKEFQIVFVEIREFKDLNDTYSMADGDYVLRKITEYLKSKLRKKDRLYKITGSIFTVIFNEKQVPEETLMRLIQPVQLTMPQSHQTLQISFAAGVTRYPEDSTDINTLINNADVALNAARKSETKRLWFYAADLEAEEKQQREAEALIKESLANDYFFLVYQPQFSLSDKALRGFETLIRCRRPDGSIVSPAMFIPAAEKSNLILKIDEYVLRRAMKEFKPVLDEKGAAYTISVNVSAKNIGSPDFAERVKKLLEETAFPPSCLEIEITEYSLAESMDVTIANIKSLREQGIQIALDDFGTGYTSIAQLMRLPINLLKIDKSLIDDIESSPVIRDLVDSVIYMGHIMNCEVISEGVENKQQINVLREHKCDFVQGFVWGKPLPFNNAVELCK